MSACCLTVSARSPGLDMKVCGKPIVLEKLPGANAMLWCKPQFLPTISTALSASLSRWFISVSAREILVITLRAMKIETLAVHAGRKAEAGSRDVTPAIHLSTTFKKDEDGSLPGGYLYARTNNPNRESLEKALALLEDEGAVALAFSSGSAATLTIFQSLAPGDHVIAPEDAYYGTTVLLKNHLASWGLTATLLDMRDLEAIERAVTAKTRLIWVETPSNPLLNVTDIRGVAAIAKKAGAFVVCDNTWATPLLQSPLTLGADVSMHSVTKYLSGHSDVLSGALIFRRNDALFEKS